VKSYTDLLELEYNFLQDGVIQEIHVVVELFNKLKPILVLRTEIVNTIPRYTKMGILV
jgi:hypothetical protein